MIGSRGFGRILTMAASLAAGIAGAREVSTPTRKDAVPVTEALDAHFTRTRNAAIVESWKKSPGDAEKALVAVWKAFVFPIRNRCISSIELSLSDDPALAPGLDWGALPPKEARLHTVFAPTLLLRRGEVDLRIGTDKFGHFFEEGFFCRQVAREDPARGEELARGMSHWLEGMETDEATMAWIRRTKTLKAWWIDEEGRRDYDLAGCFAAHKAGKETGLARRSSPADVEANLAGMRWYDALATLLAGAPKDRKGLEGLLEKNPARVTEIVTERWDEAVNPNVEGLDSPPKLK